MGSSIRSSFGRAALVLAAHLAVASGADAQRGTDTASRIVLKSSVSGRVETPGPERPIPIAGVTVTLHRVGPDSSGPVDSARTDAAGRYSLRYHRFGDEAVYFAAAVYHGIAYFSVPLRNARASGDEALITVFDTTSRPVQFHVRGHHVVVSAPNPDGARDIVEVWELSNDTTVTVIGRDTLSPVWSTPLPRGATNVVAGQGDVGPSAIAARGDRVVLIAPFGPGVKQLSYSYSIPPSRFPLTVALEQPTSVFEVLLEEPAAQVTGASLRAMDPASTGGRTFKRFLGQDVGAGESARITAPIATATTRARVLGILAGAIALIMAVALARALIGRDGRVRQRPPPAPTATEALAAAIAALDARRESGDPTLDAGAYAAEREILKAKLADALAVQRRAV